MTEDYTDVYHDENGTVIPEKSFAPTAEDVEKLLSGSVEGSPSFAKLLNGEKQKHAGLSKSLEELLGVPVTVWVSLSTVDELKDASGKSHYFNGGMKASSKLDF